jgi:phage-related tail protein
MTRALLTLGLLCLIILHFEYRIWEEVKKMAENQQQEDADIQALTQALKDAAQRISDKLTALEAQLSGAGTLTDAQQANLDALKAEVAALGQIAPAA